MLAASLLIACAALQPPMHRADAPSKLAASYADGIRELNEKHARAPGKELEDELAKKLPASARRAFDDLLALKDGDGLDDALASAADSAVELDLAADFERVRARVADVAPDKSKAIGVLVSRERFVVRGVGGLEATYVEHFADVFDAILGAYDELFGFAELSKVPGKKLRVLVHLEPQIDRPPHFAPEFPFHSQIDFPVADAKGLESPTPDGKFLFYGLCHELGHVVAMWGDAKNEEDRHAWAHYTGVAVVEHLAHDAKRAKLLGGLRDAQWRSLEKERDAAKKTKPSLESRDSVMALLIALHDAVGPNAIGAAINALDAADKRLRINRVRYYTFAELKQALLDGAKNDAARKQIKALLP